MDDANEHVRQRTLAVNGLLAGNLLQHTSSLGDSITRLTNANVDDKLLNADVAHDVCLFSLQTGNCMAQSSD